MIKSAIIFLIGSLYAIAPAPDLNRGERPAGEAAAAGRASRFAAVDVFIDSGASGLAAYQFELTAAGAGEIYLVGVEGGEHAAYRDPPYYDERALWKEQRIVIADFSTAAGDDLPRGRTRVARVMVYLGEGRDGAAEAPPDYSATLEVAASEDARPIDATISVSPATSSSDENTDAPDPGAAREGADQ